MHIFGPRSRYVTQNYHQFATFFTVLPVLGVVQVAYYAVCSN